MSRAIPIVLCTAVLVALPATSSAKGPLPEPDDGPDPRGLTISGSGVVRVMRPARLTDQSIEHAVLAARPRALASALDQARRRAGQLAAAAGLQLGEMQAVTEARPDVGLGFVEPRSYCRATRGSPGRASRCRFPAFTTAHVTVTFATAQTANATPAGRAVVATEAASARIVPFDRRSSASIRHAVLSARLAAAPLALAAARQAASATATAAGMQLGALFSIAEIRRPYDEITQSSFGEGRFCGITTEGVFRRDPATGRNRVVRRVKRWRCYAPSETAVGIRVTYLPG